MTWIDESIIEHNIAEAMEQAQLLEIPLSLIDALLEENCERDN